MRTEGTAAGLSGPEPELTMTADTSAIQQRTDGVRWFRPGLYLVCSLYLVLGTIAASSNLDVDEFSFIREPYELLGGDYTIGYLREHNFRAALRTLSESYYFYWKYRPLFSPIVAVGDKALFQSEERHFGYVKPTSVSKQDQHSLAKYSQRLVVPEPDRFYSHGAGKPLLPALISIPQLALVKLLTPAGRSLLYYQYHNNYHPLFILARLAQIASGLVTVLLTYWILEREYGSTKSLLGAALVALLPVSIKYFPNLHHDSILAPFCLASLYFFYKEKYLTAGIFFGLALASKNVAIVLIPTFVAFAVGNALSARRNQTLGHQGYPVKPVATGLAKVLIAGVLVLTPFASPVSYAQEILTPVLHGERDLRGENVEQFTLRGQFSGDPHLAEANPVAGQEIRLANMAFRLETNDFFFVLLACLLFWSGRRDQLSQLCFVLLLCALPLGLVFGYGLNYRSLLFVPMLAIVCAAVAPKRYLLGLAIAFFALDLLYGVDPIRTDALHVPVNKETLWGEIATAM
jgi:Dolichyl-phosphate-mannose-protein mannosyltransferase